jgi:hypothetical protein
MKIYIWKEVEKLTDSYHDGGGCAVIAEDLVKAREQLPKDCEAQKIEPDFVTELKDYEFTKCFIFPDAGCC